MTTNQDSTTSPVQPHASGFWLTDRDLRSRLREAVAELVATLEIAVQDEVNVIDGIESFASVACQSVALEAVYVPLVQAQAAHVIANWLIDESSAGPLDIGLLFSLDDFLRLPEKVQASLLHHYVRDCEEWEDFATGTNPILYLDRYDELQGE